MISKTNYPKIDLKDRITVEGQECIISQIYGSYSTSGVCEVVTNPSEPINRDVLWDGQQWAFSPQPTLVNAAQTSRLKEFVALLLNN